MTTHAFPSFESLIPQYADLGTEVRKSLYRRTLGYAFRLIPYQQYADHLRSLNDDNTPTEVREWVKLNVSFNGYVMKHIKHWLYHSVFYDLSPEKLAEEFQIPDCDIRLASLVSGALSAGLYDCASKYDCLDLHDTDKLIERVWVRNRPFTMRFCWAKLRFVCNQQGYTLEEVADELMTEGMRALLHAWPRYPSELYCDNLFKRTIHNCGINLIDKMTSDKHARLVADGNGFRSLNLHLDAAMLGVDTSQDVGLTVDMCGTSGTTQEQLELKISLDYMLKNRPGFRGPRQQQLIRTLGYYVPEFTQWLREHRYVSWDEDNEHLRERTNLNWYTGLAAQWLEVEQHKVWHLVRQLQASLFEYRPH